MKLQYMKIARSLLYMNLTGNEFLVYSYLLDKFQNVLDKYNNNIELEKVYHSEEQTSIAKKLHLSTRTLKTVLKSLESKHFIKIACGKNFGEKNTYYMTDIRETDNYKQLDARYKFEYEPKVTSTSVSTSSSIRNTNATRGTAKTALDYNKYIELKHVNSICRFLTESSNFDFSFLDMLELKRNFNLSDYSQSVLTIKELVDYLKERFNIDIPETALKKYC